MLMEQMFPGWTSYFFSFEEQSISERIFLVPVIVAMLVTWKLNERWLPYLLIVQLLLFVPAIFQMFRMLGKEHAHPWLGLGGLYQLVWMLVALFMGLVGHWLWSLYRARDREG